jgi:hypothetical protein
MLNMSGLGMQSEISTLKKDARRLTEFLSASNSPINRRRIAEIVEELKRIEKRLSELA